MPSFNIYFYCGYQYNITIETNNPPITQISGHTNFNIIVPMTFNSTHYSMELSSYFTSYQSSFNVMVSFNRFESTAQHVFTIMPPNFEGVKSISNDLTQFEIIGNGLKHNNFYNFLKDIRCDQDMSFDPIPTINSIERIGSFLLIDAEFHCQNYEQELYGSLENANRNSKTQYTFDPESYDFSMCLENDNYNISLISDIKSQTNYSSHVIL
ncbi:hypothetical protein ACTFIT_004321 [Dictyostelium discoideum]